MGIYLLPGSNEQFAPASAVLPGEQAPPTLPSGPPQASTLLSSSSCSGLRQSQIKAHALIVKVDKQFVAEVEDYNKLSLEGDTQAAQQEFAAAEKTQRRYASLVGRYEQIEASFVKKCGALPKLKPPHAPKNLVAVAGDGQVGLRWSPPLSAVKGSGSPSGSGGPVKGYYVYESTRVPTVAALGTKVNKKPITALSYDVKGLTNGTIYYFTVEAENVKGPSSPSNQVSALPHTTGAKLAVSPTISTPGSIVVVSGSGFAAGHAVALSVGGYTAAPLAAPIATSGGTFVTAIVVPAVMVGNHSVVGTESLGSITRTGAVVLGVHPRLAVQPVTGSPGQQVNAGLAGFHSYTPVTLHWGSPTGTALSTTTSDLTGNATTTFTIPSVAAGVGVIWAVASDGAAAELPFTVRSTPGAVPTTTGILTPGSAGPGVFVRVTVSGLKFGELVTTLVDGTVVDQTLAGASGTVDVPIFTPATAAGSLPVEVIGAGSGAVANQSVTVTPRLTFIPTTGPAGSAVDAVTMGFPGTTAMSIRLGNAHGATVATGISDAIGTALTPFAIPTYAAAGSQQVTAVGGSALDSALFTVT
jgi:hypothetical protein